jgi:hypothetical protein
MSLNVVVKWLTQFASDSGVLGSNLGLETCSPGVPQAPQVNSGTSSVRSPTAFLHILCSSLLTDRIILRCELSFK